jgi:CubicO group peptidase (beta-lactamase class C family)
MAATRVLLLGAAALLALSDALGPGPGAWEVGVPEDHGLDTAQLVAAGIRVATSVPYRHCFVVVKDGKIMHELYAPGNSTESKFETDSVGKTMTASMFGTAVTQGKLDLDKPLREYNVKPSANWSAVSGIDYFPNVTARHLLSQSSGYGRVPPGTFFTYDSWSFIQHLSDVLGASTGEPPISWATREYAEKMGLEDLFLFDNVPDGGVSAGGGQLMTCRDLARVGTLLVQRGSWEDARGEPYQLLSEDYVKQQLTPSFPDFNGGYDSLAVG